MVNNVFKGRSFIAEKDFSKNELMYLVDFALHLKKLKKENISHKYLEGKNIALLFEKTSTRTRSAFSVASYDLGAHVEFLGKDDIQFGAKESVKDSAIVLGSMFDGIEFRGFKQEDVETLSKYSNSVVWNGLTDLWHPTQMIADFMTIKELFGYVENINLVYVGDGRNNMANSLLVTSAILGVNITILAPDELQPCDSIIAIAKEKALESGSKITIGSDIDKLMVGADVVYTDVWVSMGEEDKFKERIDALLPYQVNSELMLKSKNENVKFLHCLPAFHDVNTKVTQEIHNLYGLSELEVTDEVFNGSNAHQFEQAENRLHSIKAIMAATLGDLFIPYV